MITRQFLICAAVLFLTACASAGTKIDQSKMGELKKGKSTYDDVIAMYGPPTQTVIKDDGSKMAIYYYISAQARPESFIPYIGPLVGGADSENTSVILNFDKHDILQSYTSSQGSIGSGTGFRAISQPRNDAQPGVVK
jgi:hypothetical protein